MSTEPQMKISGPWSFVAAQLKRLGDSAPIKVAATSTLRKEFIAEWDVEFDGVPFLLTLDVTP